MRGHLCRPFCTGFEQNCIDSGIKRSILQRLNLSWVPLANAAHPTIMVTISHTVLDGNGQGMPHLCHCSTKRGCVCLRAVLWSHGWLELEQADVGAWNPGVGFWGIHTAKNDISDRTAPMVPPRRGPTV